MSCPSAPPPLELKLNNDPDGFDPFATNVVSFGLGDPSQVLKLSPATSFINSAVHIGPPCDNRSNPDCSPARYGRIYDSTASTKYAAADFNNWNGSHNAGQTTVTSTYFNELLRFNDSVQMYGAPFVTLDTMLDIPNVFGIGPDSTIISQAYDDGLITSNSWSLYAGTVTSPGSLILGGYSNRFITGKTSGRASDPGCPLCFQVVSITLDTANNSIPILTSAQSPFMAQLEPFANWMAFPKNVFDNWVDLTAASNTIQDFAVYNSSRIVPAGNLTIKLGSGVTVTISNDDLFTANRFNGNGSVLTPPEGNTLARVRKSLAPTGVLGLPFMSQVYMIYDNHRQSIGLSNAVPGAISNNDIVRICPPETSSTTPPSNVNSTTPASSSNSSASNYAGAIAGGVVGFVALLIAIVVTVFLILRHKRKNSHRRLSSDTANLPLEKDSRGAIPLSFFATQNQDEPAYRQITKEPVEMYHRSKVEMPAGSPTYELPSSSMKGPADLNYERFELSSEPTADATTLSSWDGSTARTNIGTTSPNLSHGVVQHQQSNPKWI